MRAYLGKQLTEVIVDDTWLRGHGSERGVVTHRAKRRLAVRDHRKHEKVELLDSEAERKKARIHAQRRRVDGGIDGLHALHALNDIRDSEKVTLEPRGKVLLARGGRLELLVVDDAALERVNE